MDVFTKLEQANNQAAAAAYREGRNLLFRKSIDVRSFVDCQADLRHGFHANGVMDQWRLNDMDYNTKYMHSVADQFWDHLWTGDTANPDMTIHPADLIYDGHPYTYAEIPVLQVFHGNDVAGNYDSEQLWTILGYYDLQQYLFELGGVYAWEPDYNAPDDQPYDPFDDIRNVFPAATASGNIEAHLQVIQDNNYDTLFYKIYHSLTADVELWSINTEQLFDNDTFPVVRSKFAVEMQEPLFNFLGMSPFHPSSIFPSQDFYPAFIQDFTINPTQKEYVQFDDFSTDTEFKDISIVMRPQSGGLELQTRSLARFDQREKNLQRADIRYPFIYRMEKVFTNYEFGNKIVGMELEFETSYGLPDYVFIRVEREALGNYLFFKYPPVIKTISFELYQQDVKSVSDLTEVQLAHATRRNSNFRSDTLENRKNVGGVLLGREDFANFNEWESTPNDNFTGKFIVHADDWDDTVTPSDSIYEAILDAHKRLIVLFIYENYGFTGTANNCRFWRS